MAFIEPIFSKVIEKESELLSIVGPGIKYAKTAEKVIKFSNPVKATTYTVGILLDICGGKVAKYSVLCTVWETSITFGVICGNPTLIGLGIEAGSAILEDFID